MTQEHGLELETLQPSLKTGPRDAAFNLLA